MKRISVFMSKVYQIELPQKCLFCVFYASKCTWCIMALELVFMYVKFQLIYVGWSFCFVPVVLGYWHVPVTSKSAAVFHISIIYLRLL